MGNEPITLAALNAMDRDAFVRTLGGIFEHSPWIAEAAWASQPFADLDALHRAMAGVVAASGKDRQLALVRAHPELAGEAMRQRLLTQASAGEQSGAGLTALGPEDAARFDALNAAYRTRFGFPFIIAVREHTKDSILAAFERRLAEDADSELATALDQIARIARYRLQALITG